MTTTNEMTENARVFFCTAWVWEQWNGRQIRLRRCKNFGDAHYMRTPKGSVRLGKDLDEACTCPKHSQHPLWHEEYGPSVEMVTLTEAGHMLFLLQRHEDEMENIRQRAAAYAAKKECERQAGLTVAEAFEELVRDVQDKRDSKLVFHCGCNKEKPLKSKEVFVDTKAARRLGSITDVMLVEARFFRCADKGHGFAIQNHVGWMSVDKVAREEAELRTKREEERRAAEAAEQAKLATKRLERERKETEAAKLRRRQEELMALAAQSRQQQAA